MKKKPIAIQKELFVAELGLLPNKTDKESLEFSFFSLSKKKDTEKYRYQYKDYFIEIVPSSVGRPTIYDQDILIYAISQLINGVNQGQPISRTIKIETYSYLQSTSRSTGGKSYHDLEEALDRLQGSAFKTNIPVGDKRVITSVGFIDNFQIITESNTGKVLEFTITLNEYFFQAVKQISVLTINPDYFLLTSGIERKIYQIGRKHLGNQDDFSITLDNLYTKSGSRSPKATFKHQLKKVIDRDQIPDMRLSISNNLVTFHNRK